jgi:hypothetical protein
MGDGEVFNVKMGGYLIVNDPVPTAATSQNSHIFKNSIVPIGADDY